MLDRNEILSMIQSAESEEAAADAIFSSLEDSAYADAEQKYWQDQFS